MKKFLCGKTVLSLCVITFATSSFAGFWDWSRPYRGPKKDIITLMMVSNYRKAVLMADLVQNENKQPYILLPNKVGGKIFFCPAQKNQASLEILESDFTRFVSFLNPKQIVIFGDEKYVAKTYIDMISKDINIVRFYNGQNDWVRISQTVADFLDVPNMPTYYKRLYEKMTGELYKPTPLTKKPEKAATVTAAAEPKKDDGADSKKVDDEIVVEEKVVEKKAEPAVPVIVKE